MNRVKIDNVDESTKIIIKEQRDQVEMIRNQCEVLKNDKIKLYA